MLHLFLQAWHNVKSITLGFTRGGMASVQEAAPFCSPHVGEEWNWERDRHRGAELYFICSLVMLPASRRQNKHCFGSKELPPDVTSCRICLRLEPDQLSWGKSNSANKRDERLENMKDPDRRFLRRSPHLFALFDLFQDHESTNSHQSPADQLLFHSQRSITPCETWHWTTVIIRHDNFVWAETRNWLKKFLSSLSFTREPMWLLPTAVAQGL